MIEMLNISGGKKQEAKGQAINVSENTNFNVTIPENVTRINGVAIAGGGSGGGSGGSGGGGGSLVYFNHVPVKTGDILRLSVGPTAAFSYVDGNKGSSVTITLNGVAILTIDGATGGTRVSKVGGKTGIVSVPADSPLRAVGASYTVGAGTSGVSATSGAPGNAGSYTTTANIGGQSPYGQGGSNKIFGAGSKGAAVDDSSPTCAPGAIRIVWGDGREYPDNSIGDK